MDINHKVWGEKISMRKLIILIRGLPHDSNFVAFVQDKNSYSLATYNPEKITV